VTALIRHFNEEFSHEIRIRGKLRLPYTSLTFYGLLTLFIRMGGTPIIAHFPD
jgi:hypothetical protein